METWTHLQRVRKLYKVILRLHRGLPQEMQSLGNEYVRDEFRRHKGANPSEANVFLREWADYAIKLTEQLGLRGPKTAQTLGVPLAEEDLQKFKDDQLCQLYELMQAATNKTNDAKDHDKSE